MRVSLAARTLVVLASMAGACGMSEGAAEADERAHARLTYAPDADVERCPSERELKDAIASRLGYDPFEGEPGDREVVVQVHRRGSGIVGLLELRGPRPGKRELTSPRGDCRELLDAFAVAVAIGIDPASLTRPAAEPLPPPSPSMSASTGAPPSASSASGNVASVNVAPSPAAEQPAAPAKNDSLDVRLGGGPVVLVGELPAPAPGLAVSIGLRWKWLEPSVEGVATLPVSVGAPAGSGKITASLLAASFVPCGHAEVFFGCVGLTLGALRGEGEGIATPLHGSQLYAGASARGGAEIAVSRSVWLRGYVEAVAPLTRITLQLASQDVWRMPPVAARVGAAAGVRF
jgi:hypothetical protein